MCSPVGIKISSEEENDCSFYEKITDKEDDIWDNNLMSY